MGTNILLQQNSLNNSNRPQDLTKRKKRLTRLLHAEANPKITRKSFVEAVLNIFEPWGDLIMQWKVVRKLFCKALGQQKEWNNPAFGYFSRRSNKREADMRKQSLLVFIVQRRSYFKWTYSRAIGENVLFGGWCVVAVAFEHCSPEGFGSGNGAALRCPIISVWVQSIREWHHRHHIKSKDFKKRGFWALAWLLLLLWGPEQGSGQSSWHKGSNRASGSDTQA